MSESDPSSSDQLPGKVVIPEGYALSDHPEPKKSYPSGFRKRTGPPPWALVYGQVFSLISCIVVIASAVFGLVLGAANNNGVLMAAVVLFAVLQAPWWYALSYLFKTVREQVD